MRREGVIELVARTPIMGFRDDVVIRVAPSEDGARIDVRSASRYGTHDFGANAARIRSLLEDIDDAAGEISPEPQPAAAPEKRSRPSDRRGAILYVWNTLGGPNQATTGMQMMGIRLDRLDGGRSTACSPSCIRCCSGRAMSC